jgi:hypothetical protein
LRQQGRAQAQRMPFFRKLSPACGSKGAQAQRMSFSSKTEPLRKQARAQAQRMPFFSKPSSPPPILVAEYSFRESKLANRDRSIGLIVRLPCVLPCVWGVGNLTAISAG